MAKKEILLTGGREIPAFRQFTWDNGIELQEFASFVAKGRVDVNTLGGPMRGVLEGEHAGTFFSRVLHHDPKPDTVIPYRTLLEIYIIGVEALVSQGIVNLCACEKQCGLPVMQKSAHLARGCPTRFKVGVIP